MSKMLTQNGKLKKTSELHGVKIMNFDLIGGVTCPFAGECKKYCYNKKFYKLYKAVRPKRVDNFQKSQQARFSLEMLIEIIESQATHIRIHSDGDFYTREYLEKWIDLASALPHVVFYAYTKSHPLINGLDITLENFILIKSYGGTRDDLIKPDDRHAKVFNTAEEVPSDYIIANDDDLLAIGENKKIALIKH